MARNIGVEVYDQIISSWRFLHVGLALDKMMSSDAIPIPNNFESYGYKFSIEAINASWPKGFNGQFGESYFGSHIFYLSAREILSGIVEGIKIKKDDVLLFSDYIKGMLGQKFDDYDAIIRFCRNVLTHNVTGTLTLASEDFQRQKNYLRNNRLTTELELTVLYKDIFGSKYPYQGNFNISFDFKNVVEEKSLHDFVTPNQLLELVTFSGSLAECYINKRSQKYLDAQVNNKKV